MSTNHDITLDDDDLPPEDDAPGQDDDLPPEDEGSKAAPAETEAPAETVAVAEAPPAPPEPAAFVPQYSAEVPADAAQQIAALKVEERAAFKKLLDGDSGMDPDAYSVIRDRTDTAIDDLKNKVLKAAIFQQANEQASQQVAKNEWSRSEAKLMGEFKADGIDYKAEPEKLAIFNRFLKTLGVDPANEDKDAPWFLTEAHRSAKAYLGIAAKAAAPAVAERGVDKSTLPPTLSRVPPAADATIAGDEFAGLNALRGEARQRAIARLTPEQEERWLA